MPRKSGKTRPRFWAGLRSLVTRIGASRLPTSRRRNHTRKASEYRRQADYYNNFFEEFDPDCYNNFFEEIESCGGEECAANCLRRTHSLGTTDADFRGPPLAPHLMQFGRKRPISCPPVAEDSKTLPALYPLPAWDELPVQELSAFSESRDRRS